MPTNKTKPTWTKQDIANIAIKRSTYADVLGPAPKKGTPAHTEFTQRRIRLKRAVEAHLQVTAAKTLTLTAHPPESSASSALSFSFGETGIIWPSADLPLEKWKELIAELARVKRRYHRYLADAIHYGQQHYGEETVKETLTQSEFVLDDLRRANVLLHIPDTVARIPALTTEQSYVLSRELGDASEEVYKQWATTAIEQEMNPNLLARCIQLGKVMSQKDLDSQTGKGSGGIITIQHIVGQYQKWLNQVGGLPGVQKMRAADRKLLLEQHSLILQVVNLLD